MKKTPVFHSYGNWYLSGVNTWTVNIIRAMGETDFDSRVLFTGIPASPQPELDNLGVPYEFLPLAEKRTRREEWRVLKDFLEAQAPCIYLTNYDFHRSCAVGTLSPGVRVITGVRSDETCYFDELRRIGVNCDAVFCVSSFLATKVKNLFPEIAERVHFIPHGIPLSKDPIPPRPTGGPLRLCYCNRLQQYQKRVFDLPGIAAELEKLGVDYELDIAGDGRDADELRQRFVQANLKSPIRFHGRLRNPDVLEIFKRSHLFLLTSDFEGLPNSLLEAMSVGCVPVVYQIESGISDAIHDQANGFIVPHGHIIRFAKVIQSCANNIDGLRTLCLTSQQDITTRFSLERMVEDYVRLFHQTLTEELRPTRNGRITVPYDLTVRSRAIRCLKRIITKDAGKHASLEHNKLRSTH